MAPLKAGSIFHGRLASTMPARSRGWPRLPGGGEARVHAPLSHVLIGRIDPAEGLTNPAERGPRPWGASGPGSFVLAYSSRVSWRVASRALGRSRVAPKADSPALRAHVRRDVG